MERGSIKNLSVRKNYSLVNLKRVLKHSIMMKFCYIKRFGIISVLILSIIGLVFLNAHSGTIYSNQTTNSLVANWSFDEGSGTFAYDSTSNENNGLVVGANYVEEGIKDYGLYFDGIDDYVRINDSNSLDVNNAFTLDAWIKAEEFFGDGGSSGNPILAKWQMWPIGQFLFSAYSGGSLVLFITDGSSVSSFRAYNVLLPNIWYYLAATWNGSFVKFYLNGSVIKESYSFVSQLFSDEYNTDYVQIGHDTGGEGWWFKGFIDEVCIHNISLSDEQTQEKFRIISENDCNCTIIETETVTETLILSSSLMSTSAAILFLLSITMSLKKKKQKER